MERRFTIRIDGHSYKVRVGDVSRSPVEVEVDGQVVLVEIDQEGPTRVAPAPRPAPLPSQVPAEKVVTAAPSPAAASGNAVAAPMPAKVLSVAVKAGDRVSQGDTLCVLEAMKMEQVVRAPRDGIIARVHVQPGDNVTSGSVIVEFES